MAQVVSVRSYEPIEYSDLKRFGEVAWDRLSEAFRWAPVASLYKDRLLLLVLAQGGALHYENGENGLKDIDVWAFFEAGPPKPFPALAHWTADYGPSKFGRHPDDEGFAGRRMDVFGRSVATEPDEQPEDSVRRWLGGWTRSAVALREKPLIIISPAEKIGQHV